MLCLVKQEPGPAQFGIGCEVDAQQGVGRDDSVRARSEFAEVLAETSHGARYRHYLQVGGEPRSLGGPVRHHAGRCDDQERARCRVALPGVADQGEALERLAESHVVGEDSAQPVLPQESQPAEPVLLVRPQSCTQSRRRLGTTGAVGRQQALNLLPPCRRLMLDHPQPSQFLPEAGLVPADPQRPGWRILQRAGLVDQPGKRLQLGFVQREVGPIRQQQVRFATAERQE